MPEPVATPASTPTPATPEPATTPAVSHAPSISETVNPATGRVQLADEDAVFTPEIGAEAVTPEGDGDEGEGTPEKPETPAKPTETPVTPPTEKTFADGKFKTEQDLKNAFIELGGDPANFDSSEKLEQAYLVRQSEWTRMRQQEAETARVAKIAEDKRAADEAAKKPLFSEEELTGAMENIDWSKVEDAKQLGMALLHNMASLFEEKMKTLKPTAPELDENAMAERMLPVIQQREKVRAELNDVETQVPRLKSDPKFRRAFAYFIQDQKTEGSYKDLKSSMTDFISFTSGIVDESTAAAKAAADGKNAAVVTTPSEGASPSDTTKRPAEDRILEDILGAHQEHAKKYS